MNIFAYALTQPTIKLPPPGFDIKVELLGAGWAKSLARAVHEGWIDGYYSDGQLWVRRAEIQDHVAPGHCTYDEDDACCFIAPELVAKPRL